MEATTQMQALGNTGQGFTGTVRFQGTPVQVVNGMVNVMDENFFVSDDGKIVTDQDRRFVGAIQNGQFIQVTPELIDQFRQQGIFEK